MQGHAVARVTLINHVAAQSCPSQGQLIDIHVNQLILAPQQHKHGMPAEAEQIFDTQSRLQGNINIINAAVKKGVKKFILVTSIGVGDSKDAPPKQVLQPHALVRAS